MIENDRRHENFTPGNEVSTRHGAYSARRVGEVAAEVLEEWRDGDDWPGQLDSPRFANAVRSAAWAEAMCRRLRSYIDEIGQDVEDMLVESRHEEESVTLNSESGGRSTTRTVGKRLQSAYALLDRTEATAAKRRAELGLTPASEAKLDRNIAMASAVRQAHVDALLEAGGDTAAGRLRALPTPAQKPEES